MRQLTRRELAALYLERPKVSPTWLDRAVSWLSPTAGRRRAEARQYLAEVGGFEGGRRDKRSTRLWRPGQTSANEVLSYDLADLRGRSRDLVRNTPLATGAVATTVTNVVGDGLVLKIQPNKERLGLTEEQAEEWAKTVYEDGNCSATGPTSPAA